MHFAKWRISIDDFYNDKNEEVPEFQSNELYLLIKAIKQSNISTVNSMIYNNKYILFDSDNVSLILNNISFSLVRLLCIGLVKETCIK